jgi:hypothetical protein
MASYPGAVKSFTTKNAGDTIQPAHINDVQDEVAALEDGLLNGTAPINSSRITAPSAQITNATVTNLSVTSFAFPANSTLTNLNVTGGSTLASLNVAGMSSLADLQVAAAAPAVRVRNTANISVGDGSTTRLTFNADVFTSTSGMHSTGTNPGRLIATSSGVYCITGTVTWAPNATGLRQARILINGSSFASIQTVLSVGGAFNTDQNITTIYRFASSGSYAELEVYQNSGGALDVVSTGDHTPTFAMAKLR